MISLVLLGLTIVFTIMHTSMKKETSIAETFLSYLLFFNIGLTGLIAFAGHIFNPKEIAILIGWAPGSPFQYEVGMADLAFGILGILSLHYRGLFWLATVLGASIFLLGDFIIHLVQYSQYGNTAPYNIGILVWVSDFIVPVLALILLGIYLHQKKILWQGEKNV